MIKRFLTLLFTLSTLLALGMPAVPVSAASASITLDANKSTVASGGSLVVAVYMNGGGTPINAVQADVSYQSSKLQYVGFSATGSAFEISAANGGSDGLASVARATTGSVSGTGLIGTMTFKALVGTGSTTLSVASSSNLVSATDNSAVPYIAGNAAVNFGAAAASQSAVPAAPAAPKDTTPPVITAVKATGVTPFGATIIWTTNESSDSAVDYGLDTNYGLGASSTAATTAHSVALNSGFLSPQLLIHYRVKSTDGAGNVAVGQDQTLQLPGVMVTIVVRAPDGQPQPGAQVTIDGASGTTDSHGQVSLPSSLGTKKVTTVYQGVTVQKAITVAKTSKPLPPVQLDLSRKPANRWMLATVGLAVIVLTLLGIDAVLFGSHFFAKAAGLHRAHPAAAAPAPKARPAAHSFHFPALKRPHHAPKPHNAASPQTAPAPPPPPQPAVVTAPLTDPKPLSQAPVEEAPIIDPMKTVQELMGGPPAVTIDPKTDEAPAEPQPPRPPIEHFALKPAVLPITELKLPAPAPATQPTTAKTIPVMEPVKPLPNPVISTAPPLAPEATGPETKASVVAKRLKKPTTKKSKPAGRKKPAKSKK